jgi:PAS domain S-box-containing protein
MAAPTSGSRDARDEHALPGWTPLLDAMPQGVMLLDAGGRCLEVNAAAGQILGLGRQDLLASGLPGSWNGLCAADGTALAAEAFPGRVALADGTSVRRKPLGLGRADGRSLWLEVSAEPLQGGGALVSFDDITTAVLARESEERFRLAMEATSDGIWDWDVAAGEIYFNAAYSAMLGYEPHAFPNRAEAWRERIFPEDRARVASVIEQCILGVCQTFEVEHRVVTSDGGIKWVIGRGRAVSRDERGQALRMTGTILDITRRKQAEEALRVSEQKLAKIFQLSPDAIDVVDTADRVCLEFNQAYTNLFGFTREEFIGKPLRPVGLDTWVNLEDRDRQIGRASCRERVLSCV